MHMVLNCHMAQKYNPLYDWLNVTWSFGVTDHVFILTDHMLILTDHMLILTDHMLILTDHMLLTIIGF